MATALRACSKSFGVLGSAVLEASFAAVMSTVYCPRSTTSNLVSIGCSQPFVFDFTTFSRTTISLGRVTEKYGSAVTMTPKGCRSMLTLTEDFPFLGTISPRPTGRPPGGRGPNKYGRELGGR